MGLISDEDALGLLQDLEAFNGTVTIWRFVHETRTWVPIPEWQDLAAVIQTDPDHDDVDFLVYVPAALVPTGIPVVTTADKATVVHDRMVTEGEYGIRRINDEGGMGIVYRLDIHLRRNRGGPS